MGLNVLPGIGDILLLSLQDNDGGEYRVEAVVTEAYYCADTWLRRLLRWCGVPLHDVHLTCVTTRPAVLVGHKGESA